MKYDFKFLLKTFELRELKSETDILDHLALRRQIYQEEYPLEYMAEHYDLLPSDWNAILIGIFFNKKQIGTIRVVKRTLNTEIAHHLDSINEKMGLKILPDTSNLLPTEYAFSIKNKNNINYMDLTVELSRVAVLKLYRGVGLCRFAMLGAMGITMLDKFKYCLYSCSNDSVKFHADLLPMSAAVSMQQNENGYPGFTFPKSSTAILSEIGNTSSKNINQAILAGVMCRFGLNILDEENDFCLGKTTKERNVNTFIELTPDKNCLGY